MPEITGDLAVPPARGLPAGLLIPAGELIERFSRSSGPGGQGVNTSDSRVELSFDLANSGALTEQQRSRATAALASRLVGGVLTVVASEHRAQLLNRQAARARLTRYLTEALEPPAPPRRATKPSRGARQRRLDVKKQRSQLKAGRATIRPD